MNKKNVILLLINVLLISNLFSVIIVGAETPNSAVNTSSSSYVGLSIGDKIEYDVYVDEQGLDSLKTDLDTVKENQKAKLGDYGDLNASAALDMAFTNITSTEFPDGWRDFNITTFFEEYLKFQILELNESNSCINIPNDWLTTSYNILNLTKDILEGFEVNNLTIYELIDLVVDEINILPKNWRTYNFSSLMIWEFGHILNLTLFQGSLPENWGNLTLADYYTILIPGLKKQFIEVVPIPFFYIPSGSMSNMTMGELLRASIRDGYSEDFRGGNIQDVVNMTVLQFNYSMGNVPSDWEENMNISWFIEEGLKLYNEGYKNMTYSTGFLTNMSSFFNMTSFMINMSTGGDNRTIGTLYDGMIDSILFRLNNSLYELDQQWNEKTINELIDGFYGNFTMLFEGFKLMLSGNNSLPLNFFKGFNLRFTINNISQEQICDYWYFNGSNYVSRDYKMKVLNISVEIDIGLGYQDNGTIYSRIVDPGNFSSFNEYLRRQLSSSGFLFLGMPTDTSKITFRTMTIDIPEPCKDLSLNLDWDNNGTLTNFKFQYGSKNLISIQQSSGPGDAIPSFNPILLLFVGSIAMLGIIWTIMKKQSKH
ncbi:MAG: hypothetical protein EU548_09160 [Promethearchaeota archaeon]|nr:MAG: hypothetical protein EU548_09160 [Candidatus Lokiarchaeota archaeon]